MCKWVSAPKFSKLCTYMTLCLEKALHIQLNERHFFFSCHFLHERLDQFYIKENVYRMLNLKMEILNVTKSVRLSIHPSIQKYNYYVKLFLISPCLEDNLSGTVYNVTVMLSSLDSFCVIFLHVNSPSPRQACVCVRLWVGIISHQPVHLQSWFTVACRGRHNNWQPQLNNQLDAVLFPSWLSRGK